MHDAQDHDAKEVSRVDQNAPGHCWLCHLASGLYVTLIIILVTIWMFLGAISIRLLLTSSQA